MITNALFELGDQIFYMYRDEVTMGEVVTRIDIEHFSHHPTALKIQDTAAIPSIRAHLDKAGIYYLTVHGFYHESKVFGDKDVLLSSL